MIDELSRVGALTVRWRVQEFRYTEICIDIIAHGGLVSHRVDFRVVEERGSAGHVGIICGDVHSRHG